MTTKTTREKTTTAAPAPQLPTFEKGDLGKVQELLYGSQLTSIVQQVEQMSEQFCQRLEAMETHIRDELQNLKDAQIQDVAQQQNALELLKRDCHTADKALQNGISSLQSNTSKASSALSAALESATSQWDTNLDTTRAELLEKLGEAKSELQDQKIDRSALSGLLGGLAQQIDASTEDDNSTRIVDAANA